VDFLSDRRRRGGDVGKMPQGGRTGHGNK